MGLRIKRQWGIFFLDFHPFLRAFLASPSRLHLKEPLSFQQITPPQKGFQARWSSAVAVQREEVWFGTYAAWSNLYGPGEEDLEGLYDKRGARGKSGRRSEHSMEQTTCPITTYPSFFRTDGRTGWHYISTVWEAVGISLLRWRSEEPSWKPFNTIMDELKRLSPWLWMEIAVCGRV